MNSKVAVPTIIRRFLIRKVGLFFVAMVTILIVCLSSDALFDMTVNFLGGLSASQQSIFGSAEQLWEGVIMGYQTGISLTGITIDAQGLGLDGPGGTLGWAAIDNTVTQGGFELATSGYIFLDTNDIGTLESNGTLGDVIVHEMAHVLGFGLLWSDNGVYVDGSGQYTGASGLASYQTEFNQLGASFVPVELDGGSGTANYHWNEEDMGNELMTGWLDTPTFLSQTTIYSFQDIGYEVTVTPAIPEPSTIALFGIGVLGVIGYGFIRKRRK